MLATVLLSALSLAVAQDAGAPDWIGCWRAADGSGHVLLLEPERAGWLREGSPSFHRLHARGAKLTLERWSNLTELEVALGEDGKLSVTGEELQLAMEPCAVPAALDLVPYDWPEDIEVEDETVAALQQDLAARKAEDQRVRGFEGQPSQAQLDEMRAVDEDNLEFLVGIVEELGWIDAERFGREAANAAFLIVQHSSDLRLMCSALPRIEADVRAGRLGGQAYALLFDRYQLDIGFQQRYGSQIGRSERFGSVLMPCEDIEHIDERRAELGMGPLAQYLNLFRETPDAAPPAHLPDLMGGE